jgi:4-hydroxy-3-methylbut-2-enyl diphosphate reductase
MQVIPISPRGYCPGVVRAIRMVYDAIHNPTLPRPLYILGMIVHNRFVVDDLTQAGVITLDEPGKSRLDWVNEIKEGTVIVTAHGIEDNVIEAIQNKGLTLINATCKDVLKTHDVIRLHLRQNDQIIYVGKKNHPETEGALGIDPSIILVESIDDIQSLPAITKPIFVTNQTTLSIRDVSSLFDAIVNRYPSAQISDEICHSTRIRQEAILTYNHGVDLCFVVGDPVSNNTRSLAMISQKETHVPTLRIESVDEIDPHTLMGIKTVSVTSGASTPTHLPQTVIDYLRQFDENNEETWSHRKK